MISERRQVSVTLNQLLPGCWEQIVHDIVHSIVSHDAGCLVGTAVGLREMLSGALMLVGMGIPGLPCCAARAIHIQDFGLFFADSDQPVEFMLA